MSPSRRQLPAALAGALELVAPGTDLREAIENVMRAHNGALIVVANPEKLERLGVISGGMKIGLEFAPMRLYELAKMDGAILVSPDMSTIHYANVQLSPDTSLESDETGMLARAVRFVDGGPPTAPPNRRGASWSQSPSGGG